MSSSSAVQPACYYVQTVLNNATYVAVLATHNAFMILSTVSLTIWRSIGGKKIGPEFLLPTGCCMLRLIVNKQNFCLVAIHFTTTLVLSSTLIDHRYSRRCTCQTQSLHVVYHCKPYRMEVERRQKIQRNVFGKKFQPNFLSPIL